MDNVDVYVLCNEDKYIVERYNLAELMWIQVINFYNFNISYIIYIYFFVSISYGAI